MDTLMSLRVFCTIAELKSFKGAADRLHVSLAMASKHVMHLEKRLGTRLLNRTSRHISLTEAGALYFNQAKQTLDALDEIEAAVSNVTVTPRGILKFSAPVWFANPVMTKMFAEYQRRFPDVRFDIDLSGRMVNLVDEGFDLALRATYPERLDPGLIARPLCELGFCLVGSPAYLDRAGRPAKLSDLNGHALLLYAGLQTNGAMTFEGPEGRKAVKFRVVMESSNDTVLQLGALEGMGLAFVPRWVAETDITEGRLELVLPEAPILRGTLFAAYPSRKYLSAKVRTFIDFLVEQMTASKKNCESTEHPRALQPK
jgi:DNA-binding transcriptional LysR family regulator